jgi:hypothetical protein
MQPSTALGGGWPTTPPVVPAAPLPDSIAGEHDDVPCTLRLIGALFACRNRRLVERRGLQIRRPTCHRCPLALISIYIVCSLNGSGSKTRAAASVIAPTRVTKPWNVAWMFTQQEQAYRLLPIGTAEARGAAKTGWSVMWARTLANQVCGSTSFSQRATRSSGPRASLHTGLGIGVKLSRDKDEYTAKCKGSGRGWGN